MSTETFTEQLYLTYLGRPSNETGKAYWVQQIDSRELTASEVTLKFIESDEFVSSVAPITLLYYAYFDRIPDIDGLLFWLNKFKTGTSIQKISSEFSVSTEFLAKYADLSSNEAIFDRLFENVFQRSPTTAATTHWVNAFENGQSLADIMVIFSTSPEFISLNKQEIQITLEYFGILGTQPTREEVDAAVKENDHLALITDLYVSDKYTGEEVPFLIKDGTVIANGAVVDATVFIDTNGNKILDEGELSTVTDSSGKWSFDNEQATFSGNIVIFGGVDISTSQPLEETVTVTTGAFDAIQVKTKALGASLRYTTGSVPPLEENTLTVTEANTLRIFATFDQPIQLETVPIISISNGTSEIITAASMNAVSNITYYYDLDVPAGDFTGTVTINTKALQTGNVVAVNASNLLFEVNNPPAISSSDVALAIDENSGAGQIIYTAISDDPNALYSLKDTVDRALLSIDGKTGAVTLISNPDFETKKNYNFTVITSDTAGNSSSKTISLEINDLDEISSVVTGVSSTTADGSYKTGDVIAVTVGFDETVAVTGVPTLTLKVGAAEKVINYVSGSGTNSLTFNYTVNISDAEADLDYASTTALNLNGGTIKDTAGNDATLTLATPAAAGSLATNKNIVLDNVAPLSTSHSPTSGAINIPVSSNITLTFNENIALGTGNIRLTSGSDSKVINVKTDASQLSINGNTLTINPTDDLAKGLSTYTVVVEAGSVTDVAGNAYGGLTTTFTTAINTNVVIFDMVGSKSSSHSSRTFDANVDYKIYLKVDSNLATLNTTAPFTKWTGGANLGTGDEIILVGDGTPIQGAGSKSILSTKITNLKNKIEWITVVNENAADGNAFVLNKNGVGTRAFGGNTNKATLWAGSAKLELVGKTHKINMPTGIMSSQGL
jgi:hypothetical protein